MISFLSRRLLLMIPTLWVIGTLTFFMMRLAPGGPFMSEKDIPAATKTQLLHQYGLDKPLAQQYGMFLWNAAHFDFGPSYKYPQQQVREIILEGFKVSAELGGWALLLSLLLGVPIGVIAAVNQNRAPDHAAMALALAGVSIPNFVLGPVLVLVFSLTLYWLPPAGWGTWKHVILPGLTLGTLYAGVVARLTRGGLLEVVRQDFVRTAHAKGLPERLVIWRHILKGGLLPLVSYLGPMIAALFSGGLVVEKIFAAPGLGPYFADAAHNRDYFLTMGMVIFYSAFLLLANLFVDIAYGFLDPRIRYE